VLSGFIGLLSEFGFAGFSEGLDAKKKMTINYHQHI
jgi:hypothetical protein